MTVEISVVVPFYNAERDLGLCLSALCAQSLAATRYEIIAVDDGSHDGGSAVIDRSRVRLIQQSNAGAPAARNAGLQAARGAWVAFTDADCVVSRAWLKSLLGAVRIDCSDASVLGAAGSLHGHGSEHPAARYVDISGALDAQRHLAHPRFPFAPTGNVMYRRDALLAVGGFDTRFSTYDACDLHRRLLDAQPGTFVYCRKAVVLHRHRDSWAGYWRQQKGYGRGLGQFYWRHRDRVQWSARAEVAAWTRLLAQGMGAAWPGRGDAALLRRGAWIKNLAQRIGFVGAYFSPSERQRW